MVNSERLWNLHPWGYSTQLPELFGPALCRSLDQIIYRCPFQPTLFCDSRAAKSETETFS